MENNEKNTLRLRFLGAVGTVTGSCTLLEYYCCEKNQKQYFLIDAGSFQNETTEKEDNERKKVLKSISKDIKKIFITHAHLDHIGILPEIIRYGFHGEICCTQATHELIITILTHGVENGCNINLLNKTKFVDIDGRHGDKHNNGFGKTYIPIARDFVYGILRSSHVLGSCMFYFRWTEENYPNEFPKEDKEWKHVYFSGDIGPVTDKVMANIIFKEHQTPYWDKSEKCIIMESTYGETVRQKDDLFQKKIKKLEEIIDAAISKDEIVLIPAFALDRAQQIFGDLFYIFKKKNIENQEQSKDDENWENILISHYSSSMCKNIVKNIFTKLIYQKIPENKGQTFQFMERKKRKELQKNMEEKIEEIVRFHKNIPERQFFQMNDVCQKSIADVFEKNGIPKPSFDKKNINTLKTNFSFISPLIEKINEVYIKHLTDESFSDKDQKRKFKYLSNSFLQEFSISNGELSEQKEEIKKLISCFLDKNLHKESKIIVTASGMCEEGSVIYLLEKYLRDEKATIILTGFQASDTNGFLLKNLLNKKYEENNEKERIPLKLNNSDLRLADVKCTIEDMSEYYSGHADQEQLLDYITPDERNTGNITVLLNHGTNNAREALKTKIEEKNDKIKVELPEFNKWLNVVTLGYEPEDIELKNETDMQFKFVKVNDIQIYYPSGYDNEKIQSIIDHINEL
jgi:Cft2 family RNA processing exonuclease